jgi:hypothetical protein
LATRPLLPQHDGAARIVAHDVERVLADIDADHGIGCLRHGALLVFGAPCQLSLLAGQEHGRTIPLADITAFVLQGFAKKHIGVALGPAFKLGHTLEASLFVHARSLEIIAGYPNLENTPAACFGDESIQ